MKQPDTNPGYMSNTIRACLLGGLLTCVSSLGGASSDWAEAPQPAYPLRAALEGNAGEVKLRVVLNNDGRVRDAEIIKSSGKEILDDAARAAVLNWRLNQSKIQPSDI